MSKLSILIPTMPHRYRMLAKLLTELGQQGTESVAVTTDLGREDIGTKRNNLLQACTTEYCVFIDDDDDIAPTYIADILNALEQSPDVVGFNGIITTNGTRAKQFKISKEFGYEERDGIYYRFNNHLCPVRTLLAQQVGYNAMTHAEDYDYAKRLRPLVQTEVYIDKDLYFYKYITNK